MTIHSYRVMDLILCIKYYIQVRFFKLFQSSILFWHAKPFLSLSETEVKNWIEFCDFRTPEKVPTVRSTCSNISSLETWEKILRLESRKTRAFKSVHSCILPDFSDSNHWHELWIFTSICTTEYNVFWLQ